MVMLPLFVKEGKKSLDTPPPHFSMKRVFRDCLSTFVTDNFFV
jgi:hypothetical protein